MMQLKELFGFIGATIDFVGILIYLQGVLSGKTKPHHFSWLIWTVVMAIGFAAQWVGGAGAGSWVMGMGVCTTGTVFLLSLFKGKVDTKPIDWLFLILAILAIPLWIATSNPLLSVILVTSIDIIGYGPTFRKSWHNPFEETLLMWSLGCIKFIFAIAGLEVYSIITWLYPLAIILANGSLVAVLLIRRRVVVS